MIDKIYLDMDGVIVDFRGQCEKFQCIQGTNVDWKIVHEGGAEFWATMEWTKFGNISGQSFYKWLVRFCNEEDIDLYILSAVNFADGKLGKIQWLKKNTNFDMHHVLITPTGASKALYADENSVLIDDWIKNKGPWTGKKGKFVLFESPAQAKQELLSLYAKEGK